MLVRSCALCLAVGLAPAAPARALDVFACEPEWAALAAALGGERVDAFSATTALQDVHAVQARPSLIAKYRQADVVVCTGADLEIGWLPALANKGNNPAVRPGQPGFFEAARHVEMLEVPARVDRAMGDVHPRGNPHLHLHPGNIRKVAAALSNRLAQLDPDAAGDYARRHAEWDAAWQASMARWAQRAEPLRGLRLASAHRSWTYLYDWLDIEEVLTLEPKPGIPPSAGHLQRVLTLLRDAPVAAVVVAAYQDPRPARWLTEHVGTRVVVLPFTVGGADGAHDLSGLFEVTLERLLAVAPAR